MPRSQWLMMATQQHQKSLYFPVHMKVLRPGVTITGFRNIADNEGIDYGSLRMLITIVELTNLFNETIKD